MSESDVFMPQILTSKEGPRTERVNFINSAMLRHIE